MKALTVWQPYLAGVLHGDGWCTPLTLGLRVKDRVFADVFAQAINALFDLSISPKLDERGYWLVRARNKSGRFDGLRDHEPTDNDELSSWLRGLFDSEGNAQLWLNTAKGPHSYHRRIAFYSTVPGTLIRASDYLDWLEVPNSIRPTKNSLSHKGTKTVWELRVLRREGFQRFAEMVGATDPRKAGRVAAIARSYL
jgi:hypothetical protein